MLNKKEKLITDRLILKPIENIDRKRMISLLKDPEIKKTYMLPDINDIVEGVVLFNRLKDVTHSPSHYAYGIYKEDDIIGFINDVTYNEEEIEIGYFIDSTEWNKGYASEAFSALIDELKRIGFKKVVAAHFENNLASGRVMIKCGLHKIDKDEVIEYRGNKHKCIYYEKELSK